MRRSQLYVPGNNEKMVSKAASLNCDSVILDLEDAVPADQKKVARSLVCRLTEELEWDPREVCVRINEVGTPEGAADIAGLRRTERLDTIVVPKAEKKIAEIYRETGKTVIPLIETPQGLMHIEDLLASEGVGGVSYGAADFAMAVGGETSEYAENTYVKTRIAVAARAFGVEAIDNVFFDLDDQETFEAQARRAKALGFSGKQVIHPSQIPIANRVFFPTEEELEWAKKVVKAYRRAEAEGRGALRVDGRLVDKVHYRAAQRILGPREP